MAKETLPAKKGIDYLAELRKAAKETKAVFNSKDLEKMNAYLRVKHTEVENNLGMLYEVAGHAAVAMVNEGYALIQLKAFLPHGELGSYIKSSLPYSDRYARMVVVVYRHVQEYCDETKKLGRTPEHLVIQDIIRDVMHPNRQNGSHASDMPSDGSTEAVDEDSETEGDDEAGNTTEIEPHPPDTAPPIIDAEFEAKDAEILTDANGKTLPKNLRPAFSEDVYYKDFVHSLRATKRQIKERIKDNPEAYVALRMQKLEAAINDAARILTLSAPYVICSYCGAKRSHKCRACEGAGYLTKLQYHAVPDELKE